MATIPPEINPLVVTPGSNLLTAADSDCEGANSGRWTVMNQSAASTNAFAHTGSYSLGVLYSNVSPGMVGVLEEPAPSPLTTTESGAYIYEAGPVTPGQSYYFSAYGHGPGTAVSPMPTAYVTLQWQDSSGNILSTGVVNSATQTLTTNSWLFFTVTGVAPAGAAFVYPFIQVFNTTGNYATTYWDTMWVAQTVPKINTQTNDFSSALASPPWGVAAQAGGNYSLTGGQLVETVPANTVSSNVELVTWDGVQGIYLFYDLTESNYVVQLVNAGTQDPNVEVWAPQLEDINGNWYGWHIINGVIQVDNEGTILKSATYSSSTYQWLKIREHAGTTYFDYSANGSTWTNFYSTADLYSAIAVRPILYLGTNTPGVNAASTATFDNVNLAPQPAIAMSGTAGMIVYPIGPKFATLFDNFNTAGNPDYTKWVSPATNITNVGGRCQLSLPANASSFATLQTPGNRYYDLTESYALLQLVSVPSPILNSYQFNWRVNAYGGSPYSDFEIFPYASYPSGYVIRSYSWGYGWVYGASPSFGIPYDPVAHQWLRIREHAGTLYFDVSPDGNIWTNLGTAPETNYPGLTAMYTYVGTNDSNEASVGVTLLDNFNLTPATTVSLAGSSSMLIGKSPNKISTLVDGFPSPGGGATLDPTKWWVQAYSQSDVGIAIPSGGLSVRTEANITQYTQVHAGVSGTDSYWDLTESQALIQLKSAGSQSVASLEIYPIYLTDEDYASRPNKVFWYLNTGGLYAFQWVNGTQTQIAETTYSSTVHQWLKIRETGGTIYFDYSADGLVWKNFTSTPTVPNAGALGCWIQCGCYNQEVATSTTFQNFNYIQPFASGQYGLQGNTTMVVNTYMVQFVGTAKLTVAATITEKANVPLAASSGMVINGQVQENASTTQTGVAALAVAGSQQISSSVSQAATTNMTLAGTQTSVNAVAHQATAGLTVAASVKEVGSITLAGGASLSVAAIRTVLGTITETGTTTLAVATSSQQYASFNAAANTNLSITGAGTGIANIYMAPVSTLTVAATVKEAASLTLAGNAALTVGAQLSISSSVTQTGVAGLTVTGTRVLVGGVSFAGTSSLSVAGLTVEQGGLTMAGTAGLTATAGVQQISVAQLLAQGNMAVATAPLWQGQAIMSATAGMTVSSVVLISPSFLAAATAGMTVAGLTRQVASVLEAATAGLTVTGAPIIEHASVALQGTAGLSVTSVVYTSSSVAMAASASLTAHSLSQVSGSIVMPAVAQLMVTGERQRQGAIILSGDSAMQIAGKVDQFAAVVLAGSSKLTVAGVVTRWALVSLSGQGVLTVATTAKILGVVNMAAHASLTTAGVVARPATVLLAEHSSMQIVGGIIVPGGPVTLAGNAGMSVAAAPVHIFAQVAMTATTSIAVSGQSVLVFMVASTTLTTTPMVQQLAGVLLVAVGNLSLIGDLVISDAVFMSSDTMLYVYATAHGTSPFDWPDLADQMSKYAQLDPLMAGAQGFVDDVWPLRLPGPSQ